MNKHRTARASGPQTPSPHRGRRCIIAVFFVMLLAICAVGVVTDHDHDCDGATCSTCGGSGEVKCSSCNGRGYTTDYVESGGYAYDYTYGCSSCGGSGYYVMCDDGDDQDFGLSYGSGTKTCSTCGGTGSVHTHSYTSKVTKSATCTSTGTRTYTCSSCGDSYTSTIAKTSHSYTYHSAVSATCTSSGNAAYYTCSTCSGYFTSGKVSTTWSALKTSALGHSYSVSEYSWSSDYMTCTVSFGCSRDSSHTSTYAASSTSSTTTDSSVKSHTVYSVSGTDSTTKVAYSSTKTVYTHTAILKYNLSKGSGTFSDQTASYTSESSSPTGSKTFTIVTGEPTRSGYDFLGWSTSSTATSATYQPGGTISMAYGITKTLYAVWSAGITLDYDVFGGTGAPDSQTLTAKGTSHPSATFTVLPEPTEAGMTWGTLPIIGTVTVAPGQTFSYSGTVGYQVRAWTDCSASWVAIGLDSTGTYVSGTAPSTAGTYTVTATASVLVDQLYSVSSTLTVVVQNSSLPTWGDRTFLGWTEDEEGINAEYQPGDTITLYQNTTLYAVWSDATVTLTYDTRDYGVSAPPSQSTTVSGPSSASFTIPSTVPTLEGYTFLGWTTEVPCYWFYLYDESWTADLVSDFVAYEVNDPEVPFTISTQSELQESLEMSFYVIGYGGTLADALKDALGDNVVLADYDSWEDYTCGIVSLFGIDDGEWGLLDPDEYGMVCLFGYASSTVSIDVGYSLYYPASDYADGYIVAPDDESLSVQYHPGDTVAVSESTTLYALWEKSSFTHTIVYASNGGSGSMSDTVVTDTTSGSSNVTLASNGFTYTGYHFTGWLVGATIYQPGATVPVSGDSSAIATAQWARNTLTFNTMSVPEAVVNKSMSFTASASSDPSGAGITYGYSYKSSGLSVSISGSTVTCTASSVATHTLILTASATDYDTATITLYITVYNVIAGGSDETVSAIGGKPAYSTAITQTGSDLGVVWTRTSGTMPSGLSLDSSTGVVSGTYTGTTAGTVALTLTGTSSNGPTQTATKKVTVQYEPAFTLGGVSKVKTWVGNTATVTSSAMTPSTAAHSTITYSLGSSIAGVSIDSSTGALSFAGSSLSQNLNGSATVVATSAYGQTVSTTVPYLVEGKLSISVPSKLVSTQGIAKSAAVTVSGGSSNTFSLSDTWNGALTVTSSEITVSSPAVHAKQTVTVTATSDAGQNATDTIDVQVFTTIGFSNDPAANGTITFVRD